MRLDVSKPVYAFRFENGSCEGEFEFQCHNQTHWTHSKKKMMAEIESSIEEHMNSFDPPLTHEEAVEEMGAPIMYKLTVEIL